MPTSLQLQIVVMLVSKPGSYLAVIAGNGGWKKTAKQWRVGSYYVAFPFSILS